MTVIRQWILEKGISITIKFSQIFIKARKLLNQIFSKETLIY